MPVFLVAYRFYRVDSTDLLLARPLRPPDPPLSLDADLSLSQKGVHDSVPRGPPRAKPARRCQVNSRWTCIAARGREDLAVSSGPGPPRRCCTSREAKTEENALPAAKVCSSIGASQLRFPTRTVSNLYSAKCGGRHLRPSPCNTLYLWPPLWGHIWPSRATTLDGTASPPSKPWAASPRTGEDEPRA